jgi:hypothetical protein
MRRRYRRMTCRTCRHRGPRMRVDGSERESCLSHRADGGPHALPEDWVRALEANDADCELYQPAEGR